MTIKQSNRVVLEARGTTVEVTPSQVLLVRAGDLTAAARLNREQLAALRDSIVAVLAEVKA